MVHIRSDRRHNGSDQGTLARFGRTDVDSLVGLNRTSSVQRFVLEPNRWERGSTGVVMRAEKGKTVAAAERGEAEAEAEMVAATADGDDGRRRQRRGGRWQRTVTATGDNGRRTNGR